MANKKREFFVFINIHEHHYLRVLKTFEGVESFNRGHLDCFDRSKEYHNLEAIPYFRASLSSRLAHRLIKQHYAVIPLDE